MKDLTVSKIGGNIAESPEKLEAFCKAFAAAPAPKILIHGGGVLASEIQKKFGMEPKMIDGRRVTDQETLKITVMAYAGWCNKHIVATLRKYGCNAIGLAGCDASVIKAPKRAPLNGTDYGFVGDVTPDCVDTVVLETLLSAGLVPVLCSIVHDGQGQLLNTNADTVASSVAAAMGAGLNCVFEHSGVLLDQNDPSSLLAELSYGQFKALQAEGKISGGMIPKLENGFKILAQGVPSVNIGKTKLKI
ncbi:MAG: acetylglutamate kinase [Bacteroidales bacterium]|nr:acetylglutamate kinase [Bacteroidales bacterium]